MLHPSIFASASTLAAQLMSKALTDDPPKGVMLPVREALSQDMRHLGNYLQALGYLSAEQLATALLEQRRMASAGQHRALGEVLVAQGLISTQVLIAVLMVQMLDRLNGKDDLAVQFIGEQLVASGRVSASHLASALQLQIWLRQRDVQVRLGELLIQQGALDERTLSAALEHKTQG
jgi:hypothetical protein